MPNIKVRSNKQFEKIENKIDNFSSETVAAVKNNLDNNASSLSEALAAVSVDAVKNAINSEAETLSDALSGAITEVASEIIPSGGNGGSGSLSGDLKDLTYETIDVKDIKFRFEDGKVYHVKSNNIIMYDGNVSPVNILSYVSGCGDAIQSLKWMITTIDGNDETVLVANTGSALSSGEFWYRDGIGWKRENGGSFVDLTSEQEDLFYFTLGDRSGIKDEDSLVNIVTEEIPESNEIVDGTPIEITLGDTLANAKNIAYETSGNVTGIFPHPDMNLLLKIYPFGYSTYYIYGESGSDYITLYSAAYNESYLDSNYSYLKYYNSTEGKSYYYYINYDSVPSDVWEFDGQEVKSLPSLTVDQSKIKDEIAFNFIYGTYKNITTISDKFKEIEDAIEENGDSLLVDQIYDNVYDEEEDDYIDLTLGQKFNKIEKKFNDPIKNSIYEKSNSGNSPIYDILSVLMDSGQALFDAGLLTDQEETMLYGSQTLALFYSYSNSQGKMAFEWIQPINPPSVFRYWICQISMPNSVSWITFDGPYKDQLSNATISPTPIASQDDMPTFEDFDISNAGSNYQDVVSLLVESGGPDTTLEDKFSNLKDCSYETIEGESGLKSVPEWNNILSYSSLSSNNTIYEYQVSEYGWNFIGIIYDSSNDNLSVRLSFNNNQYACFNYQYTESTSGDVCDPNIWYSIESQMEMGNAPGMAGDITNYYTEVTTLPSLDINENGILIQDLFNCIYESGSATITTLEQKLNSILPPVDTTTDGTYVLKATVLDGNVTYQWVLES